MPTKLQRLIRRPAPERGFTLIELLVVIIILGILAAVVVFAVSGVGDKGKSSAIKIDERTLRTAEEAYCAKNGQYGSGQELVAGGFLSDSPKYHNVAAQKTGFGQCNGWTYSILETAAATPPGSEPGTWAATAGPPATYFTFDVVRLPNGKVVQMGSRPDGGPQVPAASLWDPATGTFTAMDPPPGVVPFGVTRWNYWPVLTETCGPNCGKVLLKRQYGANGWFLFNSEAPPGSQWEQVNGNEGLNNGPGTVTLLKDNPSTPVNECGTNCGKVLMTLVDQPVVALYDPAVPTLAPPFTTDPQPGPSAFTPVSNSDPNTSSLRQSKVLPDGRVMLVGIVSGAPFAMFFDPITLTFSPAPAPPIPVSDSVADPEPIVMANGDILFGNATTNGSTIAPTRAVYTPQYGQSGSWTALIANCGASAGRFCNILGALADGRIIAYTSTTINRSRGTTPGETWVLNWPTATTWSRVASPGGDFDRTAAYDSVYLDPRTGPCGAYCNKLFMVGAPLLGGAYSAAFFTP